MKEKRRELAAAAYAETTFADVVSHISIEKDLYIDDPG